MFYTLELKILLQFQNFYKRLISYLRFAGFLTKIIFIQILFKNLSFFFAKFEMMNQEFLDLVFSIFLSETTFHFLFKSLEISSGSNFLIFPNNATYFSKYVMQMNRCLRETLSFFFIAVFKRAEMLLREQKIFIAYPASIFLVDRMIRYSLHHCTCIVYTSTENEVSIFADANCAQVIRLIHFFSSQFYFIRPKTGTFPSVGQTSIINICPVTHSCFAIVSKGCIISMNWCISYFFFNTSVKTFFKCNYDTENVIGSKNFSTHDCFNQFFRLSTQTIDKTADVLSICTKAVGFNF